MHRNQVVKQSTNTLDRFAMLTRTNVGFEGMSWELEGIFLCRNGRGPLTCLTLSRSRQQTEYMRHIMVNCLCEQDRNGYILLKVINRFMIAFLLLKRNSIALLVSCSLLIKPDKN